MDLEIADWVLLLGASAILIYELYLFGWQNLRFGPCTTWGI
jgi:hypothetical protein